MVLVEYAHQISPEIEPSLGIELGLQRVDRSKKADWGMAAALAARRRDCFELDEAAGSLPARLRDDPPSSRS